MADFCEPAVSFNGTLVLSIVSTALLCFMQPCDFFLLVIINVAAYFSASCIFFVKCFFVYSIPPPIHRRSSRGFFVLALLLQEIIFEIMLSYCQCSMKQYMCRSSLGTVSYVHVERIHFSFLKLSTMKEIQDTDCEFVG